MRSPLVVGIVLAGACLASRAAVGQEPVRYEAAQVEVFLGATGCLPATRDCRLRESPGIPEGSTNPSFASGVTLGWRLSPYLLLGGTYRLGLFDADHQIVGADAFERAHQHTVAGLVRPILPLGIVDIGVELGPAWSRQEFEGITREVSQGFAFLAGASIDVFVHERVFVGAAFDLVFNLHTSSCSNRSGPLVCRRYASPVVPLHQVQYGARVGVALF